MATPCKFIHCINHIKSTKGYCCSACACDDYDYQRLKKEKKVKEKKSMVKITIYQCYDPNTYDSDLEGIPFEIEGYRYIIDTGPHLVIGKQMFIRKGNCIRAVMNIIKKYNMPSKYEITYQNYPNSDLII